MIDNERYLHLFNPARVPDLPKPRGSSDDASEGGGPTNAAPNALETMYEALGARWITQDVQQKCIPKGKYISFYLL